MEDQHPEDVDVNHPIQCQCGKFQGQVETGHPVNWCFCYCTDCQAFARFLEREADTLTPAGGTDIIQTEPKYVSFHQGQQYLACMRLSPRGLLRWYASCCSTPIGNTLPHRQASFVGLIHTCLKGGQPLDGAFGPANLHVHTRHARGDTRPKTVGFQRAMLRVSFMLLRGFMDGSYRQSPFFGPDGGPISAPRVLSEEERRALKGKPR